MPLYNPAQPLDTDLTAIAALTTTAFARGLLDDADAAAVRTTIGFAAAVNTPRISTVSYGATVTPDCSTTDVLNIGALTGNLTLAAPSGTPVDGQILTVRLVQDGTGGRTITYNAIYAFGTDITAALDPTAASSKWERVFQYHSGDSKWRAVGIVRGF